MGLKVRVLRHDEFDLGEHVQFKADPKCVICTAARALDGAEGTIVLCPFGEAQHRQRHAAGHTIRMMFYEPLAHPDKGLVTGMCLHWSEVVRLEWDGEPE